MCSDCLRPPVHGDPPSGEGLRMRAKMASAWGREEPQAITHRSTGGRGPGDYVPNDARR
jgi:hypothetical protein